MKKTIVVFLIAVFLLGLFSACGSKSTPTQEGSSSSNEINQDETKDIAVDNNDTTEKTEKTYNITDQIIVDNEYCSFTVSSIKADGLWGFTVKALCENKTSDKNLMFAWDDVSVLGYMIDPFWASTVAPGKKANVEISFDEDEISKCNITSVDEIVFTLRVTDSDDYMADSILEETYKIYPTGLSVDAVVYPERTPVENETVIVNNDKVSFIIESVSEDDIWGYTLNCYIENKTDVACMYSWDDVSVNGFMCDPFWGKSIVAGKRAFASISFSDSDFEENGITEVSDIEFTLRVSNDEDWMADNIFEEVFTYNPK